MTAFGGLRGATALRRARAVVRRHPTEVDAAPARLWLLGANPVDRFAVGAWRMAADAFDAALGSIEGAVAASPTPRTHAAVGEPGRSIGGGRIDGPTPMFDSVDRSSTRADAPVRPRPSTIPSGGWRPARTIDRGRVGASGAQSDVGERSPTSLATVGVTVASARPAVPWAVRAARTGGVTPVRTPLPTARNDLEAAVARLMRRPSHDSLDPGRVTASRARATAPPPGAVADPYVPTVAEQGGVRTPSSRPDAVTRSDAAPPRRLAGLARWWDETHAATEPRDRSVDSRTTAPDRVVESTHDLGAPRHGANRSSGHARTADVLDVRTVFGELLEAALLEGARADGIEVRP